MPLVISCLSCCVLLALQAPVLMEGYGDQLQQLLDQAVTQPSLAGSDADGRPQKPQ